MVKMAARLLVILACAFVPALTESVAAPLPQLGQATIIKIPLGTVVREAATVARIHLVNRQLKRVNETRDSASCGYIYTARIIELLKGQSSQIEFFSPNDLSFGKGSQDYLAFIYRRNPTSALKALGEIRHSLSNEEFSDLFCRNSEEYFVPTRSHFVEPFDMTAARRFGGDWLHSSDQDGILWCTQEKLGGRTESEDTLGLVEGDKARVISWNRAKMLIKRALETPTMFVPC